ncbi:MAG: hypothetical protein WBG90_14665 [Saonia sp.]
MAVPNNYSFTLLNVISEIPGPQDDLAECFSQATDSLFDSSYRGSKNSLRNFRNYGATQSPTIYPVNLGRSFFNQAQACTSNKGFYYISGSDSFAQATALYNNSSGTATASEAFYSDGLAVRYWDGNTFDGPASLCLSAF